MGKVFQRKISKGETDSNFVHKEVQLRNEEREKGETNKILIIKHYLNDTHGGYDVIRYCELK